MIALWMAYSLVIAALLMFVASMMERVALSAGRSARVPWMMAMGATVALSAMVLFRNTSAGRQSDVAEPFQPVVVAVTQVSAASSAGFSQLPTASPFADQTHEGTATQQVSDSGQPGAGEFSDGAAVAQLRPASQVREAFLGLARWFDQQRDFTAADRLLLSLWAAMSIASLTFLCVSLFRLNRRRGSWRRASFGGIPILVTDGVGPAVVGILKGEIAVPQWLFDLDASKQKLVIEHEKQHLVARDQLVMMGGLFSFAILPWNPLLWMMLARLRRGTEMDCDRRVLGGNADAREYATLLVDIGARAYPRALASHALSDSRTDLEHRVAFILSRAGRVTRWGVAGRVAVSAALLLAACVTPRPAVVIGSEPEAVAPQAAAVATQQTTAVEPVASVTSAREAIAPTPVNTTAPLVAIRAASAQAIVASQVAVQSVVATQVAVPAQLAHAVAQSVAGVASAASTSVTAVEVPGNRATVSVEPAQVASIRGNVTSGVPQSGALVRLIGDNSRVIDSTVTNATGDFSFPVPVTGTYYRLRVVKARFAEVLTPAFEVLPRTTVSLRIELSRAPTQLAGSLSDWSSGFRRNAAAIAAVGGNATPFTRSGTLDYGLASAWIRSGDVRRYLLGDAAGRVFTGSLWAPVSDAANRDGLFGALSFGNPPRTITTDSIVNLVAARFPQFFADSAAADSILIAVMLDSRGNPVNTKMLPHLFAAMVDEGVALTEYADSAASMRGGRNVLLRDLFPEMAGRPMVAGGSIKGRVTPRGLSARRITLIFGVVTPR